MSGSNRRCSTKTQISCITIHFLNKAKVQEVVLESLAVIWTIVHFHLIYLNAKAYIVPRKSKIFGTKIGSVSCALEEEGMMHTSLLKSHEDGERPLTF